MIKTVAILHPGAMGASVGACLTGAGHVVGWLAKGRSDATRGRAVQANFQEHDKLASLIEVSDMVIAVCPPAAALSVASAIAECEFHGVYVDANAIAPRTAEVVARTVTKGGASYVDGGIVGPPPEAHGTTRLYLSGKRAAEVTACFTSSALEPIVLGETLTAASALKMCYAAWTKGSTALLFAVAALARASNVEAALHEEWDVSQAGLLGRLRSSAPRDAPKAWRFEAEMREIANTFGDCGLPASFHEAAAEVFARLHTLKDPADVVSLDDLLTALLADNDKGIEE